MEKRAYMILSAMQGTVDSENIIEAEVLNRALGKLAQSVDEVLRAREKLTQSVDELNRSLAIALGQIARLDYLA